MKNTILYLLTLIIPVVVIVVLANIFFENPLGDNIIENIRNAVNSKPPKPTQKELAKLIKKNPYCIKSHRDYIKSSLGNSTKTDKSDAPLINKYKSLLKSSDAKVRDIGYYGLGLISAIRNKFFPAIEYYKKVVNTNLIYLNSSLGYAYMCIEKHDDAIRHFEKEIALNGDWQDAYYNLSKCLFNSKQNKKLAQLYKNNKARRLFPYSIRKFMALYTADIFEYFRLSYFFLIHRLKVVEFIGALLILGWWFVYLRRLDIFEPEKLRYLFLTLALGMLFSICSFHLYDFLHFVFKFRLRGKWLNDLLYCIFGIGFIEEFVKLIPLLLMIKFTKQVNEAVDFIIYGSVSALGFAFVENLLYFGAYSVSIMHGRALTSVLLHMIMTSTIAYALASSRGMNRKKSCLNVGIAFLFAATIHGLYDFWLIGPPHIKSFFYLSLVVFGLAVIFYRRMIIKLLIVSEFWKGNGTKRVRPFKILGYLLTSVLMYEFLVYAWNFGPIYANVKALLALYGSLLLIIFLTVFLGTFKIKKN